jgi:cobyric acid synthase
MVFIALGSNPLQDACLSFASEYASNPLYPAPRGARIAIVHFPRISNATDFRLLTWADWIALPPSGDYDFVILPGSRTRSRPRLVARGGLAD